jgi:ubiquinone/menaquinone biosynthesis C-methylase UbiE
LPGKSFESRSYLNIFNEMGEDWETIVNARDTQKESAFIQRVLRKSLTILDLCCGTGRHSIILHKRGLNIIGLDLSKNLLAIAKRNMKQERMEIPFVRADMRHLPFRNQVFDDVICMFTSFGYLPFESEDTKSFKEVRRTIRKNGKFLLDVANINHIIKIFKEKEWAEYEPFYMLEKRSLDLQQSRLTSQWTIIRKDTNEVRSLQHNVRLYSFNKLKQMLNEGGLKFKEVYGGYDGKKFSFDSPRMIVSTERTV